VGAVQSLTGEAASFGQGGVFGLQAAVDDLNKQGGILVKEFNRKIPVKLILLDDESNNIKTATLAESLAVQNKVDVFVSSPLWPPMVAAIANVAEKNKTPYISYSGPYEPTMALRQAGGNWKYTWHCGFHIGAPFGPNDFRANKPGYTMMDLWMSYLGKFGAQTNKIMAAYAADDADGRGWYEAFTGALSSAGYTLLGKDKELGMAPLGTTDFTAVINQWKDGKAEILIGNSPAPFFGTLWRQAQSQGFKPKVVIAERGAMVYEDVNAWGGNLPNGVMALVEWTPTIKAPGIGDTTPQSLADAWVKAKNSPVNQFVGLGYCQIQVLADAIQRAGSIDKEKVNAALKDTDLMTIRHTVKYDENQYSGMPVAFGQWFKVTGKPYNWEIKIIISAHDFYAATADPVFPIPY